MDEIKSKLRIISGSTHKEFAKSVAQRLGITLTETEIGRHADSETSVDILESIREKHVFIIQSKELNINDNIMELLILIHTCKLASAKKISVVLTYYPYSRQDKKIRSRTPITAKLVANLLETAGANHIITMDLHAAQIQGFFNIAVDNLFAEPLIIKYIKECIPEWQTSVIVSPDAGAAKRVVCIASKLELSFAIIHKEKNDKNCIQSMELVGNVKGRVAIIIDDMVDTGATLVKASEKLKQLQSHKIYGIVTHGVMSGTAANSIDSSQLERLVVTNTLDQTVNQHKCTKLEVIDVSPVFADAIQRTCSGRSVSYLFSNVPNI